MAPNVDAVDSPPPFDPRENEIDLLFAHANPNPTREGCPPKDVLAALARRERGLDDPGYEHLTHCSPCYTEFRTMQGETRATLTPRRRTLWWAAAALVIVAVAIWGLRPAPPGDPITPSSASARLLEIDLRPYAVSRGRGDASTPPPVVLSRESFALSILLPTGAEPGPYEARVLAGDRIAAVAAGDAVIENEVTTLQVTLDLRTLPAGEYRLAVKHADEGWRQYPAVIR